MTICVVVILYKVAEIVNDENVNEQDDNGDTPLHKACKFGHLEVVKILMSHFAKPEIKNNDHGDCVVTAISYGNTDLLPVLKYHISLTDSYQQLELD